MEVRKTVFWLSILLLSLPQNVGAGPISYLSCMVAIGGGAVIGGAAVLPLLGFTSSGIAAGSWAASMMSAYGGAVPAGSLFATLQSTGAAGVSWSSFGGISGFCAALTAPLP